MLTLKKVKELVEAPSRAKRIPSPKMLFEEGIVLLRREFDQGSHLTVYNSGYVLFSAGKRNTVFHIHDCQGDYAYDAAEGKGDVIEEEYFENCEWHVSNRIHELLRQGEYAPQAVLDAARQNALQEHAQTLAYMKRDLADGVAEAVFQDTEIFRGGFPELTDRLAGLLDDTNFLTDLNDRLSALGEAYAEDFRFGQCIHDCS